MSSAESDTRTRILQAAWRLLEEGAAGVRMSDIAKAAGVSRQAVYLHFPTRANLLIDTTRYVDEVKNIDDRLAASRAAAGIDRLDAFIQAWGDYIPEIYGISKALLAIQETDVDAAEAWRDRMRALMHGCAAAVRSLEETGQLRPDLSVGDASDLLWTLLSVRNWEHLRQDRGWSQEHYLDRTKWLAQRMLVAG